MTGPSELFVSKFVRLIILEGYASFVNLPSMSIGIQIL